MVDEVHITSTDSGTFGRDYDTVVILSVLCNGSLNNDGTHSFGPSFDTSGTSLSTCSKSQMPLSVKQAV